MTKKDYIKIADTLINGYKEQERYNIDKIVLNPIYAELISKFIIMFAADNDTFSEIMFKLYINKKIGFNLL